MKIGNNTFDSITVTGADGQVVAIVSDSEVVELNGYQVHLEPLEIESDQPQFIPCDSDHPDGIKCDANCKKG